MARPVPTVQERALAVTGAFEDGFDLAAGNYDGAGLTWGIIGFTLQHGQVSRIVLEAEKRARTSCGRRSAPRRRSASRSCAPRSRQLAWADSISSGAGKAGCESRGAPGSAASAGCPPHRRCSFEQIKRAYWDPARTTARELGLDTELGLALCFDIRVQNGSVRPSAWERIRSQVDAQPIHKERALRVIVANAVADASRPRYREDVRSRKLTLATGAGRVHAETYVLRNWGLDATHAR